MADRKKQPGKRSSETSKPGTRPGETAAGTAPPPFPIVGIGASAGGLEAYTQLLEPLAGDTGMAFVLIQHLAPTHASMLSEILQRTTPMPVIEVQDEPEVQPNHVYVIPPNRTMVMAGGALSLQPRPGGQHRPVDAFLRSLAEERTHQAVGVILSGTGNDGTLGLEAIKAAGGITFAQDSTAQQTGMPRSAIAAGCVDFVLPPAQIAAELARIGRHPYVAPPPGELPEVPGPGPLPGDQVARVLRLLHDATGVDFNHYKSSTLYRRITRRMLLHKLDGLADYVKLLRSSAGELESLYRDILVSVTSFFRDPEAVEALKERALPLLLRNRTRHDPLRVWVLGCSTGEEAYSLGIAIAEVVEGLGLHVPAQIYATDLNEHAIDKARIGLYPKSIAHDVSPERLRRFFVETESGYQISKPIRDMCVFARQNVLSDPPFSRMDLISCRNLLIYMEPELQAKVVPLFHYALKPGGVLWLGSSETIGSSADLFAIEDPRQKIYTKKAGPGPRPMIGGPLALPLTPPAWEPRGMAGPRRRAGEAQHEADRLALQRYSPPGVLLDGELDIVQFRGDTSPYLAPAPGKPSVNVLKMAREGLLVGLRSALQRASKEGIAVRQEGVRVKSNGGFREVSLEVMPVCSPASSLATGFLVLFEPVEPAAGSPGEPAVPPRPAVEAADGKDLAAEDLERQNVHLSQELQATSDYLNSLIEQQEAANEELQSANEEIQSSNEELQSINEELQTSKEEIQSSNEELTTVNEELQHRNDQLSQANDDLTNFLGSSHLALIMLGRDLTIRRFTPQAKKTLNLLATDVGRPLGDLNLPLDLPGLVGLIGEVIDSVQVIEREVQDRQGRWYLLRLRPYKTLDNRIDGAVLVLVDIDAQKRADMERRASEEKYRLLVEGAQGTAMILLDTAGRVTAWNVGAERLFGHTEAEIRGEPFSRFFTPEDVAAGRPERELALAASQRHESYEGWRQRKDGSRFWASGTTTALDGESGAHVGYSQIVRDLSDRKEIEDALRDADRHKNEFLAILAHELRNPLAPLRDSLEVLAATDDGETALRSLEVMQRQAAMLTRLVDDLLDVSRISQGKIELQRERMELGAVLRLCLENIAAQLRAKRQELVLAFPDEPLYVSGDLVRLEQVVDNLLRNAAKYTGVGGEIHLSLACDGGEAVFAVRDSGIGIAPEMLPRVFDLFAQADTASAREGGGLGIGLSLVRRLVELHGGKVTAASAGLGRGSTFEIRLPVAPAPEVPRERTADAAGPAEAFTQRRILVVDDNVDAAESLGRLLRLSGHQVETAFSGQAALAAAAEFQPEVALLDLGMPGMDGYELARHLRRQPGGDRLILATLSGYGLDEDRTRSHEAGFDAHLVKPVGLAALRQLLERR